jgi:hypothetical protein
LCHGAGGQERGRSAPEGASVAYAPRETRLSLLAPRLLSASVDLAHNHFLLVHSAAPAKYARMRNPAASIARRVLAEYRVQAVLTQVRLANMPGEGPTLGSNRYSPEQGELVEQRASAVSDTGERIVANRDREVSLLV